jgi:hypothetical protein
MFRGLILSASMLLLVAPTVFAQGTGLSSAPSAATAVQEPGDTKLTRLMLGIDFKQTILPSDGTANRFGVGFMWRWRSRTPRTDDRLAFAYRLGSYSTLVSGSVLGEDMEIGDIRVRQLLAGADYKMPRGKWTWSVGATAGMSVNKLKTAASFRERVINQTNADVVTDIHNGFAFSPRVKGWYDINRRVALMIESSYNYARPQLTIRTAAGDLSRQLNADALILKAGVVYGVW